jgi:hypothetical protein
MHAYSLDNDARKYAISTISVLSILIVWGLSKIPSMTILNIPISASLSFGLIFGALWLLFEKFIWKVLTKLDLIVDLNGTWEGTGTSSFIDPKTNDNVRYPISVSIKQTFSKLEVSLSTGKSSSKSTMAALFMNHTSPRITYSYENKPSFNADSDMNPHSGLQELFINENKMEGEYFSGRHRIRTGALSLVKRTHKK